MKSFLYKLFASTLLSTLAIALDTFAMHKSEPEDITLYAKPTIAISESFSTQEIGEFFEKGYIIVPKLFCAKEVEELSSIANSLQKVAEETLVQQMTMQKERINYKGSQFVLREITEGIQIKRIIWAAAAEPRLLELSRQPKVLSRVADLLGSDESDHLTCQFHLKIPGDGSKFDWHQDVRNRRVFDPEWNDNGNGSYIQVIVAIDEMTEENGAIKIIPRMPVKDLFLDEIKGEREEFEKIVEPYSALPLVLNAGDTLFMHPYLIHGSSPNTSSKKRRIFMNGFAYPGANHKPYPGEGSTERIYLR